MYTYICIHTCVHVCIHIYFNIYIYMCLCRCIIYSYLFTDTCACPYACLYMYTAAIHGLQYIIKRTYNACTSLINLANCWHFIFE